MKISLLAMGARLNDWINTGFQTYINRLPRDFNFQLKEVPLMKRHKGAMTKKVMAEESQRLLDAVPKEHFIIALDRTGEQIDTLSLSEKLMTWQTESQSLCFLIGGPEGLSTHCLKTSHWVWSLSKLTLPHPLVRIVFAEQIYRAWSIMSHHPYHR